MHNMQSVLFTTINLKVNGMTHIVNILVIPLIAAYIAKEFYQWFCSIAYIFGVPLTFIQFLARMVVCYSFSIQE